MHDEAMNLCKSAGRPWRAATLRGGVMFSWSLLASPSINSDPNADAQTDGDASMDHDGPPSTWRGNLNRKLWYRTCTVASANVHFSSADRALHAALAPSTQTLPALLPMCRTWEDHLWARVIVLEEERMGGVIERLRSGTGREGSKGQGGFWETGSVMVNGEGEVGDTPRIGDDDGDDDVVGDENAGGGAEVLLEDEEEWKDEVGRTLAALSEIGVEEGPGSRDAFHQAQLMIILDRTNQLIESFASTIDPNNSGTLVSFRFIFTFIYLFVYSNSHILHRPTLTTSYPLLRALGPLPSTVTARTATRGLS